MLLLWMLLGAAVSFPVILDPHLVQSQTDKKNLVRLQVDNKDLAQLQPDNKDLAQLQTDNKDLAQLQPGNKDLAQLQPNNKDLAQLRPNKDDIIEPLDVDGIGKRAGYVGPVTHSSGGGGSGFGMVRTRDLKGQENL